MVYKPTYNWGGQHLVNVDEDSYHVCYQASLLSSTVNLLQLIIVLGKL